ncbi:MAG: ACT domain-containing protein [Deltaproteobacteria bacterium]|nr:ACT domain-containing protein [Deltaproteobacteria bacterium]MBW2072118.1 ACT domain-containing protein [Deltaproteobacteria bacterium]
MKFTISLFPEIYAICRLPAGSEVPCWVSGREFLSVTHTEEELSIVCQQDKVPPEIECERGWRCLKIEAHLDFALLGVLASLTTALAGRGISVFVVSTFQTDYLLVRDRQADRAVAVLTGLGHDLVENKQYCPASDGR